MQERPASGRRRNRIGGEWETPFDGVRLRAADAALHTGFAGRPGGALSVFCGRGRFGPPGLHAQFTVLWGCGSTPDAPSGARARR